MTWYHVVPINITHIYPPKNFQLLYYFPTRGTFSKIFKGIPNSYLKRNWHDMVPCGAYQYCTHLPTQEFLIALLFFHHGDF